MEDTKNLTQLEIDNIIDETINLSIISKLLKLNIITEKQFFILKVVLNFMTDWYIQHMQYSNQ